MKLSSDYLMSDDGLKLLSKLFRSAGEGIMLFDKKGTIEMLNPRAITMFGYEEHELIGQAAEKLIPRNLRSRHVKDREQYTLYPMPRPMSERPNLQGLRKDGTTFPLEISLSYITHNEETKIVAFITDITARKNNEHQLEEQRKQLEGHANELKKKVRTRTRELEHMNMGLQSQIQERKLAEEALKKSLEDLRRAEQEIIKSLEKAKELSELKSRFVSMASHEFRTPLTTILSSANLITKYGNTDQQPAREKHVGRIKKSVQNLTSILNDFLSLEKLESGTLTIEKRKFDLQVLCNEIIDEMAPALKPGQEIIFESPPIEINTDEHILRNILLNLISNASKYSEENDPITLTLATQQKQATIEVKDEGIGIPSEEQKNLFRRFFRARNATNIQGTGLGLNIVKKYIGLIEGEICFKSIEGEGSTFKVSFPLAL